MNENDLKNEMVCAIMQLSPKNQNEFWDELVKLGFIKEERDGKT